MDIIPLDPTFNSDYDVSELKKKIREVVKEYTKTNKDISISVVYYETKSFKKIKK